MRAIPEADPCVVRIQSRDGIFILPPLREYGEFRVSLKSWKVSSTYSRLDSYSNAKLLVDFMAAQLCSISFGRNIHMRIFIDLYIHKIILKF